jgi:hypothetical protein
VVRRKPQGEERQLRAIHERARRVGIHHGAIAVPMISGKIAGYRTEQVDKMTDTRKKAVTSYRERRKRQGLVRVEVQVHKEDAPLLRSVAGALVDPEQAAEARTLLREHFASREARGLKALLAAAPLDGIDLERIGDTGRDVEMRIT